MNVLVCAASKHGSTLEIAEVIAEELKRKGLDAVALPMDQPVQIADYAAAVIGSAVYMGRWMSEARHFVDTRLGDLCQIPVWLFSSGPIGEPGKTPPIDRTAIASLEKAMGARGHMLFGGRLDPADLGIVERLAIKAVHSPTGDFRDWDAVRLWAGEIATALQLVASAA